PGLALLLGDAQRHADRFVLLPCGVNGRIALGLLFAVWLPIGLYGVPGHRSPTVITAKPDSVACQRRVERRMHGIRVQRPPKPGHLVVDERVHRIEHHGTHGGAAGFPAINAPIEPPLVLARPIPPLGTSRRPLSGSLPDDSREHGQEERLRLAGTGAGDDHAMPPSLVV